MLSTINSWPTTLQLADHANPALVCEQSLRHLEGKRLACRGRWNNQTVLIKLFLHPHSAERHLLREKKGIDLLINNQLNTPDLLFSGTLDDKTPVLIFDYLPAAQTALECWESFSNDTQRLQFLEKLMETLADQHRYGIWQNDLHLENFLISDELIYSIDGDDIQQDVQQTVGLSTQKRRENLALLFAQLPPQFESIFAAALNHYSQQHSTASKDWSTIINNELPKKRNKRRNNYIQKAYRTCSEFVRQNSFNKISIYRRDIDQDLLKALQSDPNQLMKNGTMLKDGNSSTVVDIKIGDNHWVIKRYNIKSMWHGFKRCWRPTRAWVSWGNAHRLSISHIKTPQAVALIENRLGPLRFGGYYVCAAVHAPSASDALLDSNISELEKESIKQAFVSTFKTFSQLGINHGDCKGTNFLVQNSDVWVIDLDAMNEPNNQHRFMRGFQIDRQRFLHNWDDCNSLKQWFNNHLPS